MDTASFVVVSVGVAVIASVALIVLYQNVKRQNKPVATKTDKKVAKKRRK